MNQFLFNTLGEGRVLLTIGESCPSNCFNCNNRNLTQKYFSYKKLKGNIEFLGKNFSRNFECLLFFTDAVYHPDILDFIVDPILSSFKVFTLQIHPKYTDKFEYILLEIEKLNKRVVFHVCNYYLNNENYDEVNKFILKLSNYNTYCDIDLFFDFLKYKKLLKKIIQLLKWKINYIYNGNKIESIKLEFQNIEINLYHQAEQLILNKKGYITNIYYKNCISYDSFNILDNSLNIKDEVMLLSDGGLTFHRSTFCSKAIINISNKDKGRRKILNDFIRLKKDLGKYNNSNKMGFNCYKCINTKINYSI